MSDDNGGYPKSAGIFLDGVQIGEISVGLEADADLGGTGTAPLARPRTASLGEPGADPFHSRPMAPLSHHGDDGLAPHRDRGPHVVPHRHRHSDLGSGTLEHPHARGEKGPTFRPGLSPRGKGEAEKPHTDTLQDVHKAVEGHDILEGKHFKIGDVKSAIEHSGAKGSINRDKIVEELKNNPALLDRYARAVFHETSGNQRLQIEAEAIANRALAREHSLAKALSGGPEHYHDTRVFNSPVSAEQMAQFKNEILPKVLGGSNLGEEVLGFVPTGNASGNFAAGRAARGGIYAKSKWLGDEMFALEQFDAGRLDNLQRGTGKPEGGESLPRNLPQGVTRLGAGAPEAGSQQNVDAVANPAKASGLPAAPGAHPELETVDPRLREILGAAPDQFLARHPGFDVGVTSGRRHGAGQAQHASERGAIDLQIRGPNGALPNYGPDTTGLYTELAKIARGEMLAGHPQLEADFNWGGYFGADKRSGLADPKTGTGRPDLMHFDLGGKAYPGRAGITQAYRKLGTLPGVSYGQSPAQEKSKTAEVHGSPL